MSHFHYVKNIKHSIINGLSMAQSFEYQQSPQFNCAMWIDPLPSKKKTAAALCLHFKEPTLRTGPLPNDWSRRRASPNFQLSSAEVAIYWAALVVRLQRWRRRRRWAQPTARPPQAAI